METTDEIVFSAGTFLFACGNEEVAKLVYLAGEQVVKADTLPGLPDGGSPPILVSEEFLFPNHPLLPPALATVERSERVFFTLLSFLFLSFTLFREVGTFRIHLCVWLRKFFHADANMVISWG